MRSSESVNLPIATRDYDLSNEQTMRRTVEQAYSELRNDVASNELQKSKPSTLALRRFQFMLMGAS